MVVSRFNYPGWSSRTRRIIAKSCKSDAAKKVTQLTLSQFESLKLWECKPCGSRLSHAAGDISSSITVINGGWFNSCSPSEQVIGHSWAASGFFGTLGMLDVLQRLSLPSASWRYAMNLGDGGVSGTAAWHWKARALIPREGSGLHIIIWLSVVFRRQRALLSGWSNMFISIWTYINHE